MNLFKTTQQVQTTPTFSERLSSIKTMFQIAHENASSSF